MQDETFGLPTIITLALENKARHCDQPLQGDEDFVLLLFEAGVSHPAVSAFPRVAQTESDSLSEGSLSLSLLWHTSFAAFGTTTARPLGSGTSAAGIARCRSYRLVGHVDLSGRNFAQRDDVATG